MHWSCEGQNNKHTNNGGDAYPGKSIWWMFQQQNMLVSTTKTRLSQQLTEFHPTLASNGKN